MEATEAVPACRDARSERRWRPPPGTGCPTWWPSPCCGPASGLLDAVIDMIPHVQGRLRRCAARRGDGTSRQEYYFKTPRPVQRIGLHPRADAGHRWVALVGGRQGQASGAPRHHRPLRGCGARRSPPDVRRSPRRPDRRRSARPGTQRSLPTSCPVSETWAIGCSGRFDSPFCSRAMKQELTRSYDADAFAKARKR